MLRKSLIPVFVALMIAVGSMGLAHARTERTHGLTGKAGHRRL